MGIYTIKLSDADRELLTRTAAKRGTTRADVIRDALATFADLNRVRRPRGATPLRVRAFAIQAPEGHHGTA